jgi:hypothetical protein
VAQIAVTLARILDNPKGFQVSRLGRRRWAAVLDKLRSSSGGGRRGRPALDTTKSGSNVARFVEGAHQLSQYSHREL